LCDADQPFWSRSTTGTPSTIGKAAEQRGQSNDTLDERKNSIESRPSSARRHRGHTRRGA
jgi:hypothetical protein